MTAHVRAAALRGSTAVPRSIIGHVRADGANVQELLESVKSSVTGLRSDLTGKFDGLQRVVNEFQSKNDESLKAKVNDSVLTDHVNRINGAIDEGKAGIKAVELEIKQLSSDIDKLSERLAANATVGNGSKRVDPRMANEHYPAYAKAFETYFRKGDKGLAGGELALRDMEIKASMTIGSDPDGGYTVLPEIETTIDEVVKQISPMRDIATVRPIGTSEYKKLVNLHGTASGWVGEIDSRPQTAAANLSELKFPVMEMYAMPAASQSLLDDSFVDIGAWLAGEVQLEFAFQEGSAFISGDGKLKPAGFLGAYPIVANSAYAWGKLGYIATGAAGAFKTDDTPPKGADCLIDTYHSINTMYRKSSTWVANRSTLGAVRKLKDGQGNYLLNMVLQPQGFVEDILGRPAVEMPDMPDIAANSYSMAFGDFKRGYLIIDRVGIRVLRDPFSSKPYVLFYTTKRVGGGVQNFEAIKLLKFAAS